MNSTFIREMICCGCVQNKITHSLTHSSVIQTSLRTLHSATVHIMYTYLSKATIQRLLHYNHTCTPQCTINVHLPYTPPSCLCWSVHSLNSFAHCQCTLISRLRSSVAATCRKSSFEVRSIVRRLSFVVRRLSFAVRRLSFVRCCSSPFCFCWTVDASSGRGTLLERQKSNGGVCDIVVTDWCGGGRWSDGCFCTSALCQRVTCQGHALWSESSRVSLLWCPMLAYCEHFTARGRSTHSRHCNEKHQVHNIPTTTTKVPGPSPALTEQPKFAAFAFILFVAPVHSCAFLSLAQHNPPNSATIWTLPISPSRISMRRLT